MINCSNLAQKYHAKFEQFIIVKV